MVSESVVADEVYTIVKRLLSEGRHGEREEILSRFQQVVEMGEHAFPSEASAELCYLRMIEDGQDFEKIHQGYMERKERYLREGIEPLLRRYR